MAVTSQAAEKVYRALNEPARIKTSLKAHKSAGLHGFRKKPSLSIGRVCIGLQKIQLFSGSELLGVGVACARTRRTWRDCGRREHNR